MNARVQVKWLTHAMTWVMSMTTAAQRPATTIAEEEMAAYQATARKRKAQEEQALARRQERAWALAQQAANLLRERFGATRVVVFGSLAHEKAFTPWSDVDIAAWGIRPEDTWRAVGAVMDLDAEMEINLVDVSSARPSVLAAIEREGLDL
jgi:predicted nucleotidyltransferase